MGLSVDNAFAFWPTNGGKTKRYNILMYTTPKRIKLENHSCNAQALKILNLLQNLNNRDFLAQFV